LVLPALALLNLGCALDAIRPPTPATDLQLDPNEAPPPGERFYVLIWASQTVPKAPNTCHSSATVVRASEDGSGKIAILEVHTISWLPATLDIRTFPRHPEPGVNLTLKESLDYARDRQQRISLWGPYECRVSFYKRFLVQKQFLETSGIGYQCVDNWGEAAQVGNGCNCIHAMTDSDPEYGRDNYPLIWFGDSASEHHAIRLRDQGSIQHPDVVHDEVLQALKLDDYTIRRRYFGDRYIDFARLQPAEVLFGRLRDDTQQAPPYSSPPFPPPGNREH
jgi:hypothetical protein